ncbi:MAG: heterodisulfide reductase-related iron-sulfur binding cluster [Thermodesulforhabdaceae bacterium]|jgi:glycerol-3-phosphate dehydrogenase subunit C
MEPETIVREIIEECGDCDVCRDLMDGVCFFFPKLYEIWDKEKEGGIKATFSDLRSLVENCHFCALCPCEPVRSKIIKAKIAFIKRDGLPWSTKLLENVELTWGILRKIPAHQFMSNRVVGSAVKKLLGIHESRQIPFFPDESFDIWAKKKGLTEPVKTTNSPKVAYFVGCTGRFLFPQVPKSFVNIMERLGIPVYVFEQHCCGMPALLEGDMERVLSWLGGQIKLWFELVSDGYDIVCSCPTCSFMLRRVIPAGVIYSDAVQKKLNAKNGEILVPIEERIFGQNLTKMLSLHKRLYENVLVSGEYFSDLDPVERFVVASHTFDAGEYILKHINSKENFSIRVENQHKGYVYFPPCHQREQKGEMLYYMELFNRLGIEGISSFTDSFGCCGLGGIRGFSQSYHEKSVAIGKKLVEKIDRMEPRGIITECLSCRIQFEELTDYDIVHPLEVINQAMK